MQRDAAWEYLRGALWVLPTMAVLLALALGSGLSAVEISDDSPLSSFVFQGTADDARSLLIAIASTMVTVIALVLGLTIVALQLASTQFSPRLLRNFLRDRVNQIVLSILVATFAYTSAGLYTVGVSNQQRVTDYPRVAVTGALVLLFVSLLLLVFFAHHLAHSIQIDSVMSLVERTTLDVVRKLPVSDVSPAPVPIPPDWAVPISAERSGYVQAMHLEPLITAASTHDALVTVAPMIGEHVIAGSPLVWVWRPTAEHPRLREADWMPTVHDSVRIGFERTMEQDAAFGVRQLADIASKALSPAINDPYTAAQALDHLAVILSELAARPLGNAHLVDDAGRVRVVVHGRDFGYFVDLACGQIRRFGKAEPRVVNALLRNLQDVGRFCTDDDNRSSVARQVELVLADAEAAVAQPAELVPIREQARAVLLTLGTPSAGSAGSTGAS
jgi:uncharacterized membrane protein